MAAVYVNGIKTSCMAIGGGGTTMPTKYWCGNQSEYDALQSYDDDTLYQIQVLYGNRTNYYTNYTSRFYIGSEQIFPPVLEGYDYFIENLSFPDTDASGREPYDYEIDTGIRLSTPSNYQKPWQLEFKATLSQTASLSGDQVIIGSGNSNGAIKEIYFNTSGDLCMYGNNISDEQKMSDANGHDIKIIHDGTDITIYKDGVLATTLSDCQQQSDGDSTDLSLGICRYTNNRSYRFHGTIHYLKFKWLPTS